MQNNRAFYSEFLDFMVECGALRFGQFELKSGRRSPYFINTGEYKTGKQLSRLGDFYKTLIYNSLGRAGTVDEKRPAAERKALKTTILSTFDVLFGPAYKGIPLVTTTSAKLADDDIDLKVSFDRKERKTHGEGTHILGYCPQDGDRIAIIEDVTTAGTSVRDTLALLEQLGIDAKVVALYISVDRRERGTGDEAAITQLKQNYGIAVHSIATAENIIDYLENAPAQGTPIPDAHTHARNIRAYLQQYGGK